MASNTRRQDPESSEWRNGDPPFLSCHAWGRPLAENIAESLEKGMRVIAQGAFRQRSYVDRADKKRTVYERRVGGQYLPAANGDQGYCVHVVTRQGEEFDAEVREVTVGDSDGQYKLVVWPCDD